MVDAGYGHASSFQPMASAQLTPAYAVRASQQAVSGPISRSRPPSAPPAALDLEAEFGLLEDEDNETTVVAMAPAAAHAGPPPMAHAAPQATVQPRSRTSSRPAAGSSSAPPRLSLAGAGQGAPSLGAGGPLRSRKGEKRAGGGAGRVIVAAAVVVATVLAGLLAIKIM